MKSKLGYTAASRARAMSLVAHQNDAFKAVESKEVEPELPPPNEPAPTLPQPGDPPQEPPMHDPPTTQPAPNPSTPMEPGMHISDRVAADPVTEAGVESFPASDPPAWTTMRSGG